MQSLLVVLDHLRRHYLVHLVEASEQVEVQNLVAHRRIESFDEGVLVRLAGLGAVRAEKPKK